MPSEIPTLDEIETMFRRLLREELAAGKAPEMLSIEEAADRLGVHVATIRRQVKAGRLPATRVGNRYRIPATALRPENDAAEVIALAHSARFRR